MENMNMEKKNCACGGSCGGNCGGGCGMQMHGCHSGKYHLMKMILKIVIIILIFWCGFKLGEMTGFVRAEYGRGTMMDGGGFGMMRGGYSGNGMMNPGTGTATPATPAQ
jgi:hypothetical protein